MSKTILTIDFGQLTVEETYTQPIIRLVHEMRSRSDDPRVRDLWMELAEQDLENIQGTDAADFLETAGEALEAWEERAQEEGITGYAQEGWYFIEVDA